ncbi:MAG: SRPBCC domain-containing protein [Nocardioidaceae bacterium]
MSSSTELSLAVDRIINASPETVYRLLTEPDLYAKWFGPEGADVSVEELDLRLGGRLGLEISLPAMDLVIRIEGFYEVIEPPVRLVHTWRSMDEELVTTVSFELEPQGSQTRLSITHHGFVDPVDLEQNRGGWDAHLSALAELGIAVEAGRS